MSFKNAKIRLLALAGDDTRLRARLNDWWNCHVDTLSCSQTYLKDVPLAYGKDDRFLRVLKDQSRAKMVDILDKDGVIAWEEQPGRVEGHLTVLRWK